ncbi:MAG: Uma2 family endonuclease [Planctomycetes bacterium]|nr:Uma2 family endonuclease [Planctomycetota bacterium]
MSRTALTIGPRDHGRRMTLDEFDAVDAAGGYVYELGRGVVTVVEVPGQRHLLQVDAARRQFDGYREQHPGRIHVVAGSGECKVLVAGLESERHPDLAIYLTPPPEEDLWATWIPEIALEVVSPGSEHRDYVEKREEYLSFGVTEYWILDFERREMLVLRRSRGQWVERRVGGSEPLRTRLLPGFEFSCGAAFRAAGGA